MKIVCKKIIVSKFVKPDKSWTKGKIYNAKRVAYDSYAIKDNSGIVRKFSGNMLKTHFDIIHGDN